MEDAERGQLAVWSVQLERPGERRDIPEALSSVRNRPSSRSGLVFRLETAEKLEDEAVA